MNNRHAAWLGRLGRKKRGGYAGAWCARYNNHYQWMKFDLSRPMRITKVATQGRQDYNQWVTRYTISSSLDGTHWAIYRFKSQDKYFQANRDRNTIVTHAINPPLLARYVRIHPRGWSSRICMRVELYGCRAGKGSYLWEYIWVYLFTSSCSLSKVKTSHPRGRASTCFMLDGPVRGNCRYNQNRCGTR